MERLSRTSFSTDFETFLPSRQESVDFSTLEYDKEEYDQSFFKQVGVTIFVLHVFVLSASVHTYIQQSIYKAHKFA